MAWDIAVAGTLHVDDITTPAGRREVLGGSAVYFALAASRYAQVHLNGITGADTAAGYRDLLDPRAVDLEGLVISSTPTFRWHAEHDFEVWATRHESAEPGCDPEWRPSLPPAARDAPVLHLASMEPSLQRAVLEQSHARLIGADSMTVFMERDRVGVMAVVDRADILFADIRELRSLAGGAAWQEAARSLIGPSRLRAVVVKRGPLGAACVTGSDIVEAAAAPVAGVVDPTGAGDALAGGFLGHCAAAERDDPGAFAAALAEGTRWAARAISAFGAADLS